MDEVFGSGNFVSLISFVTTSRFLAQASGLGRSGRLFDLGRQRYKPTKESGALVSSKDRAGYNWLKFMDGTESVG